MAQIRWSADATRDLEEIAEYIAKDSPRYAKIVAGRLFESVDVLREFPQIGRIIPELQSTSRRELVVGNFRILYRLKEDMCEILSVLHSKKDIWKFLESREL